MKISELQHRANQIVIKNPCAAEWRDMDGDETVRFCGQCKKNVHNLSAMSPEQLEETLANRESMRLCVFMSKREDGTVLIDNCPKFLRKSRDRIRAHAYALALTLTWALATDAFAADNCDSLVQRFSSGQVLDFGYDTARDISRICTFLAFIIAFIIPRRYKGKLSFKRFALELLARLMLPICVHLAGTFIVNNYGGIGGGGL